MSQILEGRTISSEAKIRTVEPRSPVGNNPEKNKSLEIVMTNRTAAAVILLQPIKDSLAQGHNDRGEANQRCGWGA